MIDRVRHPGVAPKDIDRGPASARLHRDWWAMRLTVEEQLALTARKGHKSR